jgi:hypothetical protein
VQGQHVCLPCAPFMPEWCSISLVFGFISSCTVSPTASTPNSLAVLQVAEDWKGWDRLRHPPSVSPEDEETQWGIPESQVRQMLFQGDKSLLETLANLLESSEARRSFRCGRHPKAAPCCDPDTVTGLICSVSGAASVHMTAKQCLSKTA